MAQQAIVTLTAITPGIVPHKRVLKLNPECQTVAVGRASKSISKGLISAEHNAWFDNPVMSRDHAELTLKQEDMSIVIKDVHSMHGTQVNNEKLSPDEPKVVMAGDILSFGAEVRRGPEVFPPCEFRVEYEYLPWTRGFQFPDSSDLEDEQDHSEEEAAVEDSQEEEMTPVETPPRKQSTMIDAIDLTSDDVDPAGVSTGPKVTSSDVSAVDNQARGRAVAPIIIDGDSDQEDEDDSEAENQDLDYPESPEVSEDDSDKENNEESEDSQYEIDDDECGNEWENSEILDTESNLNTSQISEIAPISARMFHDNKDIMISNIRTTAGMSDDKATHDEVQTGQLTDKAAWDNSLSDENEDESSQDGDVEEHLHGESQMKALPSLDGIIPPFNKTDMSGSYIWPNPVNNTSNSALVFQELSSVRQPSPSDAAMAKSQTMDANQTINPVQIHHLPGNQFSHFVPNTLGEKSGKRDFFEAREINRARVNEEESHHTEYNSIGEGIAGPKFNHLGHPYNPRPSVPLIQNSVAVHQQSHFFQRQQQGTQQIPRDNNLIQQRLFQQQEARQQAMQQHLAQAQAQAQQRFLLAQQSIFTQNTLKQMTPSVNMSRPSTFATLRQQPPVGLDAQSPALVARAPSPELDMTSAVKFNESKAAMAAVQSGRSAVRIDDIVEPSSTELDVKCMKRKASEISNVLEEEVHVWASKDSSISATEINNSSVLKVPTGSESQHQALGPAQVFSQSTSADSAPAEPAYKRVKKFAEVAGYTALGGLAGGLAIFAALVATAPDFL